jgi:prophage regulatory protein
MVQTSALTNENALLRLDNVKKLTGIGRSTIYKLIAQERFPKPVHPAGSRIAAWVAGEIDQWLQEQIARERDSIR